MLVLTMMTSQNVKLEFTVSQTTRPIWRTQTVASNTPWEFAMEEFERLYALLLKAEWSDSDEAK